MVTLKLVSKKNMNKMFQTKRIIEFGMCDRAGILFFPKIFELFHSAYEEFILSNNLSVDYFNSDHYAIPIIKTVSDFKAPIKLHEEINIAIQVEQVRNSSFELTTFFFDDNNNEKALVSSIHMFVEKRSFNKIKIPSEFIEMLEANSYQS